MTHVRPFRNGDSPALARLWNREVPASAAARPLTVGEFDTRVAGSPIFDAAGLLVAVRDGAVVGFAHAGFGPESPDGPPLVLSRAMGTVGMLLVDSNLPDAPAVEVELLAAAEAYLAGAGTSVVYAGGQYPLNPFYWGLYGGSEWAGILGAHASFRRVVARAGYEPVGETTLLERDLDAPDPRDPRILLTRRQTRLDVSDDVNPDAWWDSLALGDFRPTRYTLVARADESPRASALAWDMSWFGRHDGRSRIGLVNVEVDPAHRRQGFGRCLIAEIVRRTREEGTAAIAVQTRSVNDAALALYRAQGFEPVETATLYRRPASG